MRKRTMIVNGILAAALLSFLLFPSASASTTQWFPQEGTKLEYNLKHALLKTNGNWVETSMFDVYNTSTIFDLFPSTLNHIPTLSPSYTSLKNGSRITMRTTYTSISVSDWRRMKTILVDGVESSGNSYRIFNMNGSYYPYDDVNVTVAKFGFFSSVRTTDYVNCSARLGEIAYNHYKVMGITSTEFMAFANYTYSDAYEYDLYTCNLDGRVKEFTRAYQLDSYAASGIHSTYVTITSVEGSGGFLLTTDQWIMVGCGGIGVVVGLLIGVAVGKKKRNK